MKPKRIILFSILCIAGLLSQAQNKKTDANIIGHVTCCGEHIPFATVSIKGTVIGVSSDESGHFQLINLPVGKHIVVAQSIGYKPKETEIEITYGQTLEIKFELEKDALSLNEIVVTGDRNESNKKDAVTVISVISPKLFVSSEAQNLSQSLQYASGLRIENNCQNCGFNQVRMNGMEGPYSQILINSRPIFSSLAGVYGLELIPSNMIERVEIIRGGGSALYGSNAIAGTINVILKDPIANTYEFSSATSLIGVDQKYSGNFAPEYHLNFNSSMISNDARTGMAIYASHKNQQAFDANNDGFTELAKINGISVGSRIYHRFDSKSKMNLDIFSILENRRGGNKLYLPEHESDIAESVEHRINSAAISYDRFFNGKNKLSIFFSLQHIHRDSYYGARQSLSDYGLTKNLSYSGGIQYNASFKNSSLNIGVENNAEFLTDTKKAYSDIDNAYFNTDSILFIPITDGTIIADQKINTIGSFAQYSFSWKAIKIVTGLRFDHYSINNIMDETATNSASVLIPRLSAKYNISEMLQLRASYSHGYRAPQIFDEDLHIETSGSRQMIHINAPDLTREKSRSYMVSLDFNTKIKKLRFNLLAEAFYTQLMNPFANEISIPDSTGRIVYTRVNAASGANVQGINFECNAFPSEKWDLKIGYTIQKSQYTEAREFNETQFFRTPNDYGFMNLSIHPRQKQGIDISGIYTGKMLLPYYGPAILNPEEGELRTSNMFFNFGMKIHRNIVLNGATLQLYLGVKNILNSYQNDFDLGIDRDPAYIYGPTMPRTIYFGVKIGNAINF